MTAASVFELVVEEVFHLRDRGGIAVVGPEPAAGMLRSGDVVEVVRDGQVIHEAIAHVELHARPGHVALLIPDQAAAVRVGDRVRGRTARPMTVRRRN